ncbi:MAG: RNA-binding transcriptional accessory protein [Anaerolineaceae bacterium 4572_32.2]|nr:MAG: RNA-binding transcriptional accessory protein [Anaerolineaceae bacterium 4572_32.2]HEY74378.1 RNA-binding transcriptional accessory protein [Thermoflexia bacterium]
MDSHTRQIAAQLNLRPEQVAATVELLDAGNTLPFIARYRKEVTGGLDEEQIRQLSALLTKLRKLDERRQTVIATIEGQGQLTPELRQQLLAADTLATLEDLYRPYKPRRRTRASVAREKGLQGLADLILEQVKTEQSLAEIAALFLSNKAPTVEEALAGARDIVAETISDHAEVRSAVREKAFRWGALCTEKIKKADDQRATYRLYYDFELRVNRLRPHQILAINRGEAEKVLRVRVEVPERDWQAVINSRFRPDRDSPLADQLVLAADDAAQRLLLPAIERDTRRALTEQAETHAISVFAANLRALLNRPPLAGHTVLGIDPGFRTGCKVAVVDPTGKVLDTTAIYPHAPQKQWQAALDILSSLVARHAVTLIVIGNGTASRESEQLIAELIRAPIPNSPIPNPQYLIVSEAGASVYSASKLARAELPAMDVSMRGAVSIARRVQDPLAELVKITPQSIGVGMYQHDVDQAQLAKAAADAVESVVNSVGVDLNTASPALLTYVAGIGPKLAARIVAHRDENGPFLNRRALKRVPGLGPKTFEQAAGFLRVLGGDDPLDGSAIHPESYPVAKALLARAGLTAQAKPSEREAGLAALRERQSLDALAVELGAGVLTLSDILEQLIRPGRDPRASLPAPILRSDVLTMDDLRPGMRLKGTVQNVVDFGAFVDVGVKQDGLLHRSKMPAGIQLRAGNVIDVKIVRVEPERGRIGLELASVAV